MNDGHRRLRSIPARSHEQLLTSLVSVSAEELRVGTKHAPVVTLHLSSGGEIRGIVSAVVDMRDGTTVLLQTGGDRWHDPGSDMTYVVLSSVLAITVHQATDYIEVLAGGPLQTIAPPPTRLAARRSVDADRQRASDALSKPLTWNAPIDGADEGEPMRAIVTLSQTTANVLAAIVADPLGRNAMARVRIVSLELAESVSAALEGDVLRVRGSANVDDKTVRSAIEATL